MQQRIAQRGDGRQRVHDLVRQNPGELAPRLDLHRTQIVVDVAHGHDAKMPPVERDLRTGQRQIDLAAFGPAPHAQTLAGTDRRQRATGFGQQRLHLPHMRHPRQTEDTQRLVVDLVDAAPVVDGQQPRAGALHDEPVIALAFLGAQLGPHDDLADTVQRHVERPFAAGGRTLAETEIQIVVFDGIEQKGHTAHRRVVQPHELVDRDAAERQKQQGEGITPRRRQRSGSGRHGDQHDDVGYQTEEIATVFHKP